MDTSPRNSPTPGTARTKLRAAPVHGKQLRNIALAILAWMPALAPLSAGEPADENARLKAEVARLREECQTLRMLLAEPVETPAKPAAATNRVVVVVEEKTPETVLLRAECQALRKLLASPAVIAQPAAEPGRDAAQKAESVSEGEATWQVTLPPGFTYWLTTSTGVRHNPTCPKHQKTTGRPCAADEGRACKYCGG